MSDGDFHTARTSAPPAAGHDSPRAMAEDENAAAPVRFVGAGTAAPPPVGGEFKDHGPTPGQIAFDGLPPHGAGPRTQGEFGHSPEQTCGIPIATTSSGGHANSLGSALQTVGAAWQAVIQRQIAGVNQIYLLAQKDLPPKPQSAWQMVLGAMLNQGLTLAVDAVMLYLGGGLALAAWDALAANGVKDPSRGAKAVADATLRLHGVVRTGLTQVISRTILGNVTAAADKAPVDALVRETFFQAQLESLSMLGLEAITQVDNNEGDFAALEQQQAGLGFIALESYRNHLACNALAAADIQSHKTLGVWLDVVAQQKLGVYVADDWQHAGKGANLHGDVIDTHRTDERGVARAQAGGVLDLELEWDRDHTESPIRAVKSARVRGVHPDLKALLTSAPLGEFPLPVIAHGQLLSQNYDSNQAADVSELAIGRNSGGAIFLGAAGGTKGAEFLSSLGGDGFAGAANLFTHIDQLLLTKVE